MAATRRVQFSSCDSCRQSRVACDAVSRRAASRDESVSCTRCLNRNRQCTFKWIRDAKAGSSGQTSSRLGAKRRGRPRKAAAAGPDASCLSHEHSSRLTRPRARGFRGARLDEYDDQDTSTSPLHFTPSLTLDGHSVSSPPRSELADLVPGLESASLDLEWLPVVYSEGFETVFGSWMGRYSNPFMFGQDELAEKYVSISDVCTQLDHWMADTSIGASPASSTSSDPEARERDRLASDSLRTTIASFAARWLPLTSSSSQDPQPHHQDMAIALWRHARRDMLRIINRPSYRSMLCLFLFALTPIPTGISEDEELDGISGQSCVHAALQQIQVLRARQRNLQFSGSKVSPTHKEPIPGATLESIGSSGFIAAESIAYWAALTFDTSASLTLDCRPLLSSGLFGFEHELPWRLVRTTAKMFDEAAGVWDHSSLEMNDERANQIISAGATWKLLGWKLAAIVKEALRDGHAEEQVQKVYLAVLDSIKQFNSIFRNRLEACQRRMHFLSQQTKLRWYSLMLHYNLSILVLVDLIEGTHRYDLLANLAEATNDAENAVMNTLAFGLHSTFSLVLRSGSEHNNSGTGLVNGTRSTIRTVPLVSVDPYPHHIVAGVRLMRKAIDRDLGSRKITRESYQSLISTLERTLSHLPQNSKSVQAARAKFSEPMEEVIDPGRGVGFVMQPSYLS